MRNGFIWIREGPSGGKCEHGNEPSGSIKGKIFLDITGGESFSKRYMLHGVGYG
jgi:hypothetical protein